MSGNTWVIADPHFSHANILNFKRADGSPLRPFSSVEEMNETLIQNWNAVVRPSDRVYLLGDVAFHKRHIRAVMPRLAGRIVLVKGNHDTEKLSVYTPYVDDIRAYVPKKGFILSHIPIHPGSLGRWGLNIHGHLHDKVVAKPKTQFIGTAEVEVIGQQTPDPRYVCVSVEQTNYAPKLLSEVLSEQGNTPAPR